MFLIDWNAVTVDRLVVAIEEFVNESNYEIEFNERRTRDTLYAYISSEDCGVVLVEHEGALAGFALLALDRDFHNEIFGYIIKFYIREPFRKLGYDRLLAEKCGAWFEQMNVHSVFATATANIGEDKLFTNLLKKYGFEELGPTLYRRL